MCEAMAAATTMGRMPSLSTHILDASAGGARTGVPVEVHDGSDALVACAVSDAQGRAAALAPSLEPGRYQITWRLGGGFVAELSVTVDLLEERHYHVPVLASATTAVVYLGV
jgi:5-hydroxyisourate hydrolase